MPVQLLGVGVDISVEAAPQAVNFGPVQILPTGTVPTSPTAVVTFTNTGTSQALVSVDASQTDPAFVLSDASGTISKIGPQVTLAPNGSYAVTVAFGPTATTNYSTTFSWTACADPATCIPAQSIALSGVGIDGNLVLSPDPVGFGVLPAGTAVTQLVTVTNAGSNAALVGCVYLKTLRNNACAGASSVYAFGTVPTGTVLSAAGSDGGPNSVTFPLVYTSSGNVDTDELDVDYTPATSFTVKTATDPISGGEALSPCALTFAPTSINFGTVTLGTPLTKSTTLTNGGGSVCTLSGIALDGASDPSYSLPASQVAAFTLAPGASATLSATFNLNNSNTPNQRRGDIDYQSNDPAHPTGQIPLTAALSSANPYATGWPKWHYDNHNSGQTGADTSNNTGAVVWKHPGLLSAAALTASGNSNQYTTGNSDCEFTNLSTPVVADPPPGSSSAGARPTAFTRSVLDGTFYALDQNGNQLWTQKLSDPSNDAHPSTPAVLKGGNIWAVSGSDARTSAKAPIDALYYLSPSGQVLSAAPYGEDGFDACPGLGADGTLFEADDDGEVGKSTSTDPYSAIAFTPTSSSVTPAAGVPFPLTTESERFGVAIADDDSSFWGNNGQFFGVTPPGSGFALMSGWPAAGVTLTSNATDPNATGPVFSDLALDPLNTGFIYAYSAWEDGVGSNGGYYGVGQKKGKYGTTAGPYTVQGTISALSMTSGAVQWTVPLPSSPLPAGWTQSCADYGNAAPAVALDGTVYVGNGDGLRAIDGPSGSVKWTFQSANVTSAPAIGGDGTVFFGCADGTFYAVSASGSLRFEVAAGFPISSSPAIADDGTVFFVSDDGTLWAVR